MLHYENMIPVEDYQRLRSSVGWKAIAYRQAENAVKTVSILYVVMMILRS